MRVRALNSNGDWLFGQSQNSYLTGTAAVAQNIQTRLNSFLGDCFFDTGAGINWLLYLGGKDQLSLNLAVSAVILNTDYVTGLTQLSIVLTPQRLLTIQYSVTTAIAPITATLSAQVTSENLLSEAGLQLLSEGGTPLITE